MGLLNKATGDIKISLPLFGFFVFCVVDICSYRSVQKLCQFLIKPVIHVACN